MPDNFTTEKYADLESVLKRCLELRDTDFWSFRGQRNWRWSVGLHLGPERSDKVGDLDIFLNQFKRRCMEFPPPNIGKNDQWRWLFFAQHHRLKTRLLDWTKDPLVAIYFAVENILSREKDDCIGAVWALHVDPNKFHGKEKLPKPAKMLHWGMINPPVVTPRIARQSALFTFHPGTNCLTPLDKVLEPGDKLVKMILTKDGKSPAANIRKQLGILNVHHGSLFPDPEGVAQFINAEWPIIATEDYLRKRTSSPQTPPPGVKVKAWRLDRKASK